MGEKCTHPTDSLMQGEHAVNLGTSNPGAETLVVFDVDGGTVGGADIISPAPPSPEYVPPPPPIMVGEEGKRGSPKPTFLDKCKGVPGEKSPARIPFVQVLVSGITAFLGILAIALPLSLHASDDVFMLLGSFGATAALLYGAPEAALSQPRNVIGGHVLSAVIGVAVYKFGVAVNVGVWLTASLSVSVSVMLMQLTKTLHPPGAATSLLGVVGTQSLHDLGFLYIITPTLVGACIMVTVAVIGNNISGVRRYPKFWW